MKTFTLPLTIDRSNSVASLHVYLRENLRLDRSPLPTVVIIPGGGYENVSPREAEPIALAFLAQGFHAVVVDYTVMSKKVSGNFLENCLLETAEAFRLVETNALDWNIDLKSLFLIGFSAGGHLAAWYANQYKKLESLKPRGLILGYPVISFDFGWPQNLSHFRFELDPAAYNTADMVTSDSPDSFLWHTANDDAVPVYNSLRYCEALETAKVPFELHIFEKGPHGLSLANLSSSPTKDLIFPHAAQWFQLCVEWMEKRRG